MKVFRLGLLVNPVAGIGGRVGLKGSDGASTVRRALEMGARPESSERAHVALEILRPVAGRLEIFSYPSDMGEALLVSCGLDATILGHLAPGGTGPEDTKRAARDLLDQGVDLLLFAGGDGTARDVLDAVGTRVPALGIPAGCKMHSAVFAVNPRRAGEIVVELLDGRIRSFHDAEVMDIDESSFRQNRVQSRLYGYLKAPDEPVRMQGMKSGRAPGESASVAGLAGSFARRMERDTLYIVGPGSTTLAVLDALGLSGTLLGVDLVCNGELVGRDVAEQEILAVLDRYPSRRILVTVIGGQGVVFGRGNQQISAEVIRRVGTANVLIVASKGKMDALLGRSLLTDTSDQEIDEALRGYRRVIVGVDETVMAKVDC